MKKVLFSIMLASIATLTFAGPKRDVSKEVKKDQMASINFHNNSEMVLSQNQQFQSADDDGQTVYIFPTTCGYGTLSSYTELTGEQWFKIWATFEVLCVTD